VYTANQSFSHTYQRQYTTATLQKAVSNIHLRHRCNSHAFNTFISLSFLRQNPLKPWGEEIPEIHKTLLCSMIRDSQTIYDLQKVIKLVGGNSIFSLSFCLCVFWCNFPHTRHMQKRKAVLLFWQILYIILHSNMHKLKTMKRHNKLFLLRISY